MRATQREFLTQSIKTRHLGAVVQKSAIGSYTNSMDAGEDDLITITTIPDYDAPLFTLPDISIYEGSVAEANQIPNGSSVNAEEWDIIGPVNDWFVTDNFNTKTRLYVRYKGSVAEKQVSAGTDDGDYDSFAALWVNNDDHLHMGYDIDTPTEFTLAVRFDPVPIAAGSTIKKAYLIFTAYEIKNDDTDAKIYGIDEDDTATFSSDPTGRAQTTANVDWDLDSIQADVSYRSTDITAIVQEIIDRGGWVSGNAMGFIIKNDGATASALYCWHSYDGSPAQAPLLEVEYEESGASAKTFVLKVSSRVISNVQS